MNIVSSLSRVVPAAGNILCISAAAFLSLGSFCVAAEVQIDGLNGETLDNALAHLSLDDAPCDIDRRELSRLLKKGKQEIGVALEALGYYDAQIEAIADNQKVEQTAGDSSCWHSRYSVILGAPILIRTLHIELRGAGRDDPVFQKALQDSPLQLQRHFRHDQYENLKRSLVEIATRWGYADATLRQHEVTIEPEAHAADVTLQFDTGRRYAFGEVRFQQQILKPTFIARYVPFRRGEPYDSHQLAEFYRVLSGSGYFESILVQPLLEERTNGEIPIDVSLTPGTRKLYSTGLGYSTNTGPRLRASYTNRRIDEKGHQWGANLLLSDVVSELTTNYRLPLGDPRSEWLSIGGGFKHENTETSTSDAYQLGVRHVRERGNSWQESRFIDLLVEDFKVGAQESTSKMLIPGISWTRVTADNRLRPQRGLRLFVEFRGSTDVAGSDTNFLRFEASGKWIHSLWTSSRILIRGEVGASLVGKFSELPPSLRYFVGGDSSVRGYDLASLGPTDADGKVRGGKGKIVSSIELEQNILPKWSIAAFLDSGNAFDDIDVDLQSGAGIGIRWQSPVGPIRVDFAKPLDGPERSVRLHVTFGPDL